MISKYGRGWIAAPLGRIAVWLEKTGISPNALTLIGFVLTVVVAVVLGTVNLLWGGLLLIFPRCLIRWTVHWHGTRARLPFSAPFLTV